MAALDDHRNATEATMTEPAPRGCPLTEEELKAATRAALNAALVYIPPTTLRAHPPSIINLKIRRAIVDAICPTEEE